MPPNNMSHFEFKLDVALSGQCYPGASMAGGQRGQLHTQLLVAIDDPVIYILKLDTGPSR